jgi:hypothetical protein
VAFVGTLNVNAVFSQNLSNVATGTTVITTAAVASVDVAPAVASVSVGRTVQLTATPRDTAGNALTGRAVGWSSSNEAVASVNGSGLVSGVAEGTATIAATSEGKSGSASVTVATAPLPPPHGGNEPAYDPAAHYLIADDNLDSFNAFTAENGSPAFRDRYRRGRAAYPGGPSNSDLLATGTADRAEDDGVLTMVTGRGGSGKAIRLLYGGADGGGDLLVGPTVNDLNSAGELDGTLPEVAGEYEHFYFTCWFRTSPGADPAGANSSSVKGFMFWANFPNRVEWRPARLRYGGSRWDKPRWTRGGGIPQNASMGVDYWQTDDGYPPLWSNYNDGNWHRLTTEIHAGPAVPNSERGQRLWLDGEYIYDDVGRLPKLFDMFGHGAGKDWNGNDLTGGFRWSATPTTEGFSVWGNFVNGDAAKQTTQFTIDFDDWIVWTNKP